MDGVNYSSIPGPGQQTGFCSEPRGEVMVMDQLLAGEYFMGFVWCAELSQKAAGHRSWLHRAVPALPLAGCPEGLWSPEQQTALSAAADLGGPPKDAAWLLAASPAKQVAPDCSHAAAADNCAWEEAF